MDLSEGTRLGPYEIVARIGAGGMGEVYRAKDTRLDRPVAIKFLYAQVADENARRRFQQEAKTASSLNHPHILTVFEAGEWEGRQYLVSEFVDAGTLRAWARDAKPSWRQVVDMLVGVADGLACAHSAGITHRDVKPDNILVSGNGYAKLADFGLAKLQERSSSEDVTQTVLPNLTRPGAVLGTIAYMSPEQASGAPLDGRSDIFSFGIVLYELLAGQRPFSGHTDLETLQRVLHAPAKPLLEVRPDLPVALCMLVDKALQKDPAERYQTMPDLVVDMRRLTRQIEERTATIPARVPPWWKWVAAAALILMVLGVAGSLIYSRIKPGAAQPQIRSIAVLPLRNLSRDPDQEFFSDGTTEALISGLSHIHALKVISRTSIMRYRDTTKPILDIGKELGVDAIVEGSVQRAGTRVRITAQLIRAATDEHLWAQEYDRNVTDLLAVQGEVARAIAQEIRVQVTPDERNRLASARPLNPAAQDAYLLGRYHSWKLNEHDLELAVQYFERAIQLDPNFAAAYAGLSRAWHERGIWGTVGFREAEPPSRAAALKALHLDPNLSEAHTQLADIQSANDWNWTGAQQEFERALELNPNSLEGRFYYASFLMAMGRFPGAIAEIERAAALDPLSSRIQSAFGRILYRARHYKEAISHLHRAIELDSQNYGAYSRLADVYIAMGKLTQALDALEHSMKLPGALTVKSPALGRIYALLGRKSDAVATLSGPHRTGAGGPQSIALVYFALGDKDRGFEWLTKAFDEHNLVLFIKFDPGFDSVRSDPRFQELVNRLHIPDPH